MVLEFSTIELVSSLVRTLQSGSLYALMALGLTLTLAILRIPNIAHAEYVTVGAYVSFTLINYAGLHLWQLIAPSFLAGGAAATASYYAVFKPLKKRGASMFIMMVASFALALIFRYIIYTIAGIGNWGLGVKPKIVTNAVLRVFGVYISDILLMALPTSIIVMTALYLFIMRTRTGKQMRAVADDPELAIASGINPEKIAIVTLVISGGIASVAGAFWVIFTHAHPDVGLEALLRMIAATALGGFYSYPGTVVGSIVVSFSENTIMDILNRNLGLSLALKPLMPMAIITLVLIARPTGLAGLMWRRKAPTEKGE